MEPFVDIEELDKNIDIANVYARDQLIIIDQIKEVFKNILRFCNSTISNKIYDKHDEVINNINTVSINLLNYINALDKIAKDYSSLRRYLIKSENDSTQMIKKSDIDL